MCRHGGGNRPEEIGIPECALRLAQSFADRDGVVQDQILVRTSSLTIGAIECVPVHYRVVLGIRIPRVGEPPPVSGHRSGHLEVLATEDVGRWRSKKRSADVSAEQEIDVESMN